MLCSVVVFIVVFFVVFFVVFVVVVSLCVSPQQHVFDAVNGIHSGVPRVP